MFLILYPNYFFIYSIFKISFLHIHVGNLTAQQMSPNEIAKLIQLRTPPFKQFSGWVSSLQTQTYHLNSNATHTFFQLLFLLTKFCSFETVKVLKHNTALKLYSTSNVANITHQKYCVSSQSHTVFNWLCIQYIPRYVYMYRVSVNRYVKTLCLVSMPDTFVL